MMYLIEKNLMEIFIFKENPSCNIEKAFENVI